MPRNCEANDDLQRVCFDLDFEGATWKGAISYDRLARMFSAPRHGATVSDVRESRQQTVSYSKGIARLVVEQVRAGAMNAGPIVIS